MVGQFSEERKQELHHRVFREFNSLSIVYGKPSHQFIIKTAAQALESTSFAENVPPPPPPPARPPAVAPAADLLGEGDATPMTQRSVAGGDLLDMGGGMGVGEIGENSNDLISNSGNDLLDIRGAQPARQLDSSAVLSPNDFQNFWQGNAPNAITEMRCATPGVVHCNAQQVEQMITSIGFKCMASGDMGGIFKFYFYGCERQMAGDSWYLAELLFPTSPGDEVCIDIQKYLIPIIVYNYFI